MMSALSSLKIHTRLALAATLLFGGGAGVWCAFQPLAGAVVAGGTMMVESSVKKIQHPTGGVVKVLAVAEGALVKAGDLLIQLDDTTVRAALAIVLNDLVSHRARLARLQAERERQTSIRFPADLMAESQTNNAVRLVLESEQRILTAQHTDREGQKAQLRERISQLRKQVEGLTAQKQALEDQRKLAATDHARLQALAARDLAPVTRVGELQRELIKLDGSIGGTVSQIAEVEGKQVETELQILGLDKDAASEIAKDIRETETKTAELFERRIAAEDQLTRTDIRAPKEGLVHGLNVHTVGGVVGPGETFMLIVPQSEALIVETKVRPTEIDQVRVGQSTRLVLSALNRHTTPEIHGIVFRVAADLTVEEKTGFAYYTVGIRIPPSELQAVASATQLVPGMPVEAFIQTGERTVANYLLKPLLDQMNRSMREE